MELRKLVFFAPGYRSVPQIPPTGPISNLRTDATPEAVSASQSSGTGSLPLEVAVVMGVNSGYSRNVDPFLIGPLLHCVAHCS